MKQRLTINEVDNLISMLNSSDKDTILLALNIILSRSYKSTMQLNTAIYNARITFNAYKKYFKSEYPDQWTNFMIEAKNSRKKCIEALERYKEKIRAV